MYYFELNGIKLPRVSIGTSPFIGAGQFGARGLAWRLKFLNNPELMAYLMEKAYNLGAKGVEIVPVGKIIDAINIMKSNYPDYIVLASTHWSEINIQELAEVYKSKVIFLHGNLSDKRNKTMIKNIFNEISSYSVIPGIATHEPVSTLQFIINNNINCDIFLIPFNKAGFLMQNKNKLEDIVDNSNKKFIAMKPLAAGQLSPQEAFEYISQHNISGVAVGLVYEEEINETVPIAIEKIGNKT